MSLPSSYLCVSFHFLLCNIMFVQFSFVIHKLHANCVAADNKETHKKAPIFITFGQIIRLQNKATNTELKWKFEIHKNKATVAGRKYRINRGICPRKRNMCSCKRSSEQRSKCCENWRWNFLEVYTILTYLIENVCRRRRIIRSIYVLWQYSISTEPKQSRAD